MSLRAWPLLLALLVLLSACGSEDPAGPSPDPVAVTTTSLPDGVLNADYGTQSLAATGGDGSFSWALAFGSGDPPVGLTLGTNGDITGTPTTVITQDFTVEATSAGQTGQRGLAITVWPPLVVTTASLPNGVLNADYGTQSLAATGGTGSFAWTLAAASGPLPTGLSLAGNGDITGAPTTAGTQAFTVQVTSGAQTTQQPLSITVSPLRTDKILFASTRDGDWDIYVMDSDGANPTNLTNSFGVDASPAWSPDGSKIAFETTRNTNGEIYVANADGSNPENLTDFAAANEHQAEWSPDGSKIAFYSDRGGNRDIYVLDTDGSNLVRLTTDPATDVSPDWSPDGSKIAFQSNRDGDWELYVMDADGSNPVNVSNNAANEFSPTWSPDGTKIAFATNRDVNWEIYVMDPDGANPINLTNAVGNDYAPAWSPDGSKIAFQAGRDSSNEIYVMNADGSNQVNLTNDPASDGTAAWAR
jgi:Tol biopolymer transport system component